MTEDARRQCCAETLSGARCRQHTREGQDRCWFHQGVQCSVCLAYMGTQSASRTLRCSHQFHERCLNRWKLQCQGTPTCPMCREPFDVPTYKCRLIIERTSDSFRSMTDFETANIAQIIDGFGLQFRDLIPNQGRFLTDVHFDIEPEEVLRDVLRELGLPEPPESL